MVMGSLRQETEVAVIGSGPGGYVAALRLADLGKEVLLIDEREQPGGVCLHEGCIPSKALINAVEIADAAKGAAKLGLTFDGMRFDPAKLKQWSAGVVSGLARGVTALLANRGIEVMHARARFTGPSSLAIEGGEISAVDFQHCIIATGSRVNRLPAAGMLPVWTSKEALELRSVPERLLVVGGGYIGLELGLVYAGLGSAVTVAEFSPRLLPGADRDLVEIMVREVRNRLAEIKVGSRVIAMEKPDNVYRVTIAQDGAEQVYEYDQVLVAVGRRPNSDDIGLENTAVKVDEHGFVETDDTGRTAQPAIFAIGDVTTGPMLAHKASREGKIAAEVIAGHVATFDNRAIPAVVYTDPEIAWTGLTEREAEQQGTAVNIGRFPLSALGRARTLGRTAGLVKVISEPGTDLVLGVGMVGPQASELIAEATLALEMGATLEDLKVTIHPHPTLSEAIMEAAEVASGTATHLPPARKVG